MSQNAKNLDQNAAEVRVILIQAFARATKKMFEEQAGTSSTIRASHVRGDEARSGDIAAYIELNSGGPIGRFLLFFPKAVFLKIFENMFEIKTDEISAEILDGAKEFVNIIYGIAKTELNPRGFRFEPAFPKVVVGADMKSLPRRPFAVIVPFASAAGAFHVEIEFEK